MVKLALIGKNIQHSLSPQIYQKYLGTQVQYELLDYSREELIPDSLELFNKYVGVSITSPYKKYFIKKVDLTINAKKLGAINCLGLVNGKITGENTDYLAIIDILQDWQKKYGHLSVVVLGDGVMSKVTEAALVFLNIEFKILSRKLVDHFDRFNLDEFFRLNFLSVGQMLVINTCSRDFIFKGNINKNAIFWDYNYLFSPHSSNLPAKVHFYCDGEAMLDLQARYALAFWSLKSI